MILSSQDRQEGLSLWLQRRFEDVQGVLQQVAVVESGVLPPRQMLSRDTPLLLGWRRMSHCLRFGCYANRHYRHLGLRQMGRVQVRIECQATILNAHEWERQVSC